MKPGLAVQREGASPLWRVESTGARAIRMPLVHWADVSDYLRQARSKGYDVLGVMDRDGFADWGDWRRSVDADLARVDALYVRTGLVTHLALGNECDDGWLGPGDPDDPRARPRGGVSSWVMSFAEQAELVDRAHAYFGGRVPLVLGGLSSGQPAALEHFDLSKISAVQCLVPDQRVTAAGVTGATMRRYEGQVITIETTLGQKVTCTPNHPILTREGWLPAHAVHEGAQVAYDPQGGPMHPGRPNDVQVPTLISEVFRTLSRAEQRGTRAGHRLDFHGDGRDGDVNVVGAHCLLRNPLAHDVQQRLLVPSAIEDLALPRRRRQQIHAIPLAGTLESLDLRLATSPYTQPTAPEQDMDARRLLTQRGRDGIARFSVQVPLVQGLDLGVGLVERPRFLAVADVQPVRPEGAGDRRAPSPDAASDSFERLAPLVAFVEVSHVSSSQFSGHVYNLSTEDGLIITNGIVTHNCHPYGKRPAPDWPSPAWGFGYIGDLLDGMRAILDARGVSATCRLGIGELGISSYDADPGTAAEWYRRMLAYLAARGDVDFAFAFCDSDKNVDGYGLFDVTERPKPALAAVSAAFARLPDGPLLVVPPSDHPDVGGDPGEPAPEPEPEPVGWFDRHFSADEIAGALALVRTALGRPTDPSEVVGDIRANWPELGPYLAAYGVDDDPQVKLAILATIWVECIWELRPRDELGTYDRFERLYGYQTAAGRALGNLYAGDGARFHGRGYQLTGRANYAHVGAVLGVDLLGDPEAANDPTVAAGAIVLYFAEHGMFELARAGDWAGVRRAYNGGLNGYDQFLLAVHALQQVADLDATDPPPAGVDLRATLRRVLDEGVAWLGVPYLFGGDSRAGIDCSAFVAEAYRGALGVDLPHYTDAIYDATDPLAEAQALPGDLVLYGYADASQPGTVYPHVALVTERADTVLDARWPVGVGYHAHVGGAVRRYRRVRGLGEILTEDEAMWKEKAEGLINAVAYLGDDVADELERERAQLDDYGEPPVLAPKKKGKPTKAELEAHQAAMTAWAQKVRANTDRLYKAIGETGAKLRSTRVEFVGPRPT